MVATGGFTLLELLDQLIRSAVDGSVRTEEWVAAGDLFGFLLSIGDGNTGHGPGLDDLIEIPPHIVAMALEHIQLMLEVPDRATLKIPPE
jgi:hypothetical protein